MAEVFNIWPLLFCWWGICMALLRAFKERQRAVIIGTGSGFLAGLAGALLLFAILPGEWPFMLIKSALGLGFLALIVAAVASFYRATGVRFGFPGELRLHDSHLGPAAGAFVAALGAGMLCGAGLLPSSTSLPALAWLLLAVVVLLWAAWLCERRLPAVVRITPASLLLLVISLLLLMASCQLRLDLFSPLIMGVVKFVHDFVHQFFESMLIPDHLFFRPKVWDSIGLLFSNDVGLWGALILWFAPALLLLWAMSREPLPSVAHIRQGARRRKQLAGHVRERRWRLLIPCLAVVLLATGVYQSLFAEVEYWDPEPIPLTAAADGSIQVPIQGKDFYLDDGRLHKFVYTQGETRARFFILRKPDGQWTVDLDACAICQPEGYGQTEGAVICYYCRTLIPIETVGRPGGCNPVPVAFDLNETGVRLDAQRLIGTWRDNIQSVHRGLEDRR